MEIQIDDERCIATGRCALIAPDVFYRPDDDGVPSASVPSARRRKGISLPTPPSGFEAGAERGKAVGAPNGTHPCIDWGFGFGVTGLAGGRMSCSTVSSD